MMISRASAASALAISTSCRWEMVKLLTVVRGETSSPTWAGHFAGCRFHGAPVDPARARFHAAHVDVFHDAERGDGREFLVDDGDAGLLRLSRGLEVHILAMEDHAAAIAGDDAAQDVDQRGLAGAVFAHQRMHLARSHVHPHLAQGLHPAVALGDVDDLQHEFRVVCHTGRRVLCGRMIEPVRITALRRSGFEASAGFWR